MASINQQQLAKIVETSLQILYVKEIDNIRRDVSERTICTKLVAILADHFPDHAVDAELNKHGVHSKTILLPDQNGVLTKNLVSPDIVVHQPNHDEENILVIEVKKSTNPIPDKYDLQKLSHLRQQIGYRFALFLRLPTGQQANVRNVRMVWVE